MRKAVPKTVTSGQGKHWQVISVAVLGERAVQRESRVTTVQPCVHSVICSPTRPESLLVARLKAGNVADVVMPIAARACRKQVSDS